jgi:hypothetical protein
VGDVAYKVAGQLRQLGRAFYNDVGGVILKLLPPIALLVGVEVNLSEWKMLSGSCASLVLRPK